MIDMLKKGRAILCRLLELVLIVAVGILVLDVLWGVFTRYALGEQAKWSEELARFLLVWVSLLGGAVAFGEKAHLGVDYFVGKLDPAAGKFIAVFGQLVILLFALAIFIYGGIRVVNNALEMAQTTPALGWKMGHVYMAVPIAGFFIIIFAFEQLIETVMSDSSKKEEN